MKTPTKRATRRIAASIAIATALATSGAWAANPTWTGATNSYWSEPGNWDNASGKVPTSGWIMFESITDSSKLTVVITNAITCTGGLQMNNIGTSENPLTFRADPTTASLQFGLNNGTFIGNYNGDGYVRLESGTYSTGNADLYVGGNSHDRNAYLTVESPVLLDIGAECKLGRQSSLVNRGRIKTQSITYNKGTATSTFTFDGGTLEAKAAGTLVADNSYIAIDVTSNGGTIDAAGYAVSVERPIADASGETGKMTFAGGGSVTLTEDPTYTGMTTIEVGTRLAVPSAIAGDKLAFTIPAGLANGVYPVIAITGEGVFADDVLDDVTKPEDGYASFGLSGDKKTIVCLYGFEAEGDVYIGATDGDLSTAANWLSGSVPTSGAPTIFCGSAATLSVGATFAPDTVIVPTNSAVVTIGTGDLTVNTLTNAQRLAVASGASLTVTGDLVAMPTSASDTKTFLNSNEGTVTVGGKAVAYNTSYGSTTVLQYETASVATQPIRANGIDYSCSGGGQIYMKLQSKSGNTTGSWVVGPDGLSFPHSRNAAYSTFWAQSAAVTLYSSANWTLANTGKQSSTNGDLYVPTHSGSSLTIDTSDYVDSTVGRTVTLNGRIVANNPVTIKGCGTVEVNTTGSHAELPADLQHTCLSNATLSVTGTATLKINEGRKITGNGTISLAAGTTLALDSSALGAIGDTEFTPCIPSLALPETGTATLRIDGTRLPSGNHVLLDSVPENYANLTVDRAGTAIDGRHASVVAKDGQLVLNVVPDGLVIIFR